MVTNPYRTCPIVGEYHIEAGLHEAIKLNPGQLHHIKVRLGNHVKTIVGSRVSSMRSLHNVIATLRLQYTLRWGVEPDVVEVMEG